MPSLVVNLPGAIMPLERGEVTYRPREEGRVTRAGRLLTRARG